MTAPRLIAYQNMLRGKEDFYQKKAPLRGMAATSLCDGSDLSSPAFQQNGHIPSKYTCEGEDVSPPFACEGVPDGTKSLVLIINDTDAPDPNAPKMIWVHCVVYNISPDSESLPKNVDKTRVRRKAPYLAQ
jgi:phosphatidylethanolamine-binding protein (PEBP) family uncharacterized protein